MENEQNQTFVNCCQRVMTILLERARRRLDEAIANGKQEQDICVEYPDKEKGDADDTNDVLGCPCSFYVSFERKDDGPDKFAFHIGIKAYDYRQYGNVACDTLERLKVLIDTHDYSNYFAERERVWSSFLDDSKAKDARKQRSDYQYVYRAVQIILDRARKTIKEVPAKGRFKDDIVVEYPDRDAGDPDETKEVFGHECSFFISFGSFISERINPDERIMNVGVMAFGYSRYGMLVSGPIEEIQKVLNQNWSHYLTDSFLKDVEHLEDDRNIHR